MAQARDAGQQPPAPVRQSLNLAGGEGNNAYEYMVQRRVRRLPRVLGAGRGGGVGAARLEGVAELLLAVSAQSDTGPDRARKPRNGRWASRAILELSWIHCTVMLTATRYNTFRAHYRRSLR
jgi:hypothetical protein